MASLLDLSDDTLTSILAKCEDTADIIAFSKVCRRARRAAFSPSLWKSVALPRLRYGNAGVSAAGDIELNAGAESDDAYGSGSSDSDDWGRSGKRKSKKRKTKKKSPKSARGSKRAKPEEVCAAHLAIEKVTAVARLRDRRTKEEIPLLEDLDLSALGPALAGPQTLALGGDGLSLLASRAGETLKSFCCPPSDRLQHDDLVKFARACPNLRALSLNSVDHASISTLAEILHSESRIVRISVIDCRNVRGGQAQFWRAISAVASQLETIDITGCPVSALPVKEMAEHCVSLTDFHADRCLHLVPPNSLPRTPNGKGMTGFAKLAWLRVDFASGDWSPFLGWLFKMQTGLGSLRALSFNSRERYLRLSVFDEYSLPALEHLALSGQGADDRFFKDVIIRRLSSSLRTLDLSKSSGLTGECIDASCSFPVLQRLDVSGTRFTETAAERLYEAAQELTVFKLEGCRSIRDRDMRRDVLWALQVRKVARLDAEDAEFYRKERKAEARKARAAASGRSDDVAELSDGASSYYDSYDDEDQEY